VQKYTGQPDCADDTDLSIGRWRDVSAQNEVPGKARLVVSDGNIGL
jgi:hypothetical protein